MHKLSRKPKLLSQTARCHRHDVYNSNNRCMTV